MNNRLKFARIAIISTMLCSALIYYGALRYPLPWKIIDPKSSRFSASNFRFTDYRIGAELGMALACILPKGTPKKDVDKILVNAGGADVERVERFDQKKTVAVTYRYTKNTFRDKLAEPFSLAPSPHMQPSIHFSIDFDKDMLIRDAGFLKNSCRLKSGE